MRDGSLPSLGQSSFDSTDRCRIPTSIDQATTPMLDHINKRLQSWLTTPSFRNSQSGEQHNGTTANPVNRTHSFNPASSNDDGETRRGNSRCQNCQAENTDASSLMIPANIDTPQDCAELYTAVASCMLQHHGQVAPCSKEWHLFHLCHDRNRHYNQNNSNPT
jgi:hypothetical protein